MREALKYQTIIQNTFKTVRNTLMWLQILQKQIQKRAQGTNIPNSQTKHIQNTAQNNNVQNKLKTVRDILKYQTIIQNTFKTVRKALT